MNLNEQWEKYLKDSGADVVCFVDASTLPLDDTGGCNCVVLFGKALSKEYVIALRAGQKPKRNEAINLESKMNRLAAKLTEKLEAEGHKCITKFKFALLPHKMVALRAGLGFIGKNNLLVNEQYGCTLMLGKVLTSAPFVTMSTTPKEPSCGDCSVCVDMCPTKALLGTTWNESLSRDDIMVRKHCKVCGWCMVWCPYTEKYAE